MSTPAPQLKSINCTECGAPLDLHGGRQVKSISCPYCGAVLDNKDEYKVVEKFLLTDRPHTTLKIGQEGLFHGVKFTIIGLIQYKSDGDKWLEYQLFSPTHGYSWLTLDSGHYVFGHKVRYYPEDYSTKWKSKLKVNDKKYKVIDNYVAYVAFVEGELTWIARKDDKVKGIDAIAPPFIYSIEKTKYEEEYSLGEYFFAEDIYKAFGRDDKPTGKSYWVHPAQPYKQGKIFGSLTHVSKLFAKIYLVICLLLLLFVDEKTALMMNIPAEHYQDEFISKPFSVDNPDRFLRLNMISKLNNDWAFFDIKVKKDNTEVVYSVGKEMYYYFKNAEKKDATKAIIHFKVPSEGNYTLSIHGKGEYIHSVGGLKPLYIELKTGVVDTDTFWSLLKWTVFFGWVWPFIGCWRFNRKRWRENE